MTNSTCETCRFMEGRRCHRFPPKLSFWGGMLVYGFGVTEDRFPQVKPHDWCGEYQEKEPRP